MASKDASIKNFNMSVSWLLNCLIKLNPRDIEVERVKSRVTLAKGADREVLLKECGPYLFRYQNYINTRDDEFFLKNDPEEINAADAGAQQLIKKVREQYVKLRKEEKDQIYEKVSIMLTSYLEYLTYELNE
jgi:hypothetical protein